MMQQLDRLRQQQAAASVLWDFDQANPTMWHDPSDSNTIVIVDGLVADSLDKSPNGYDLTQPTVDRRFAIGSRTQNGLNVFDVDGTAGLKGLHISNTLFTKSPPIALMFVAKLDDLVSPNAFYDCFVSNVAFNFYTNANDPTFRMGGSAFRAVGAADTNVHIHYLVYNGTSSYWSLDGAEPILVDGNYSGSLVGLILGTLRGYGSLGYTMDGFYGDFVLWNSAISASLRQHGEGRLAHKWGLTANLPAGHPYKTNPPTV